MNLTASNAIPGADVVGFGCNAIDGPYSTPNQPSGGVTRRIFSLGDYSQAAKWEFKPTTTEYLIPPGISNPPGPGSNAFSAKYCHSRSEFSETFKTEGSVSASYGAFSAQIEASYSSSESSSSERSYLFIRQDGVTWNLTLDEQVATLDPTFLKEVSKLPDTFSPANADVFFAFVRKWGTHYVQRVNVGGQLYYYVSVEQNANLSEKEATASMTAEYKGLIAKAKAESDTEWKKVQSNYSNHRETRLVSVGPGNLQVDTSLFTNPEPSWAGGDVISDWQRETEKNPGALGTSLRAIHHAIPDKARAIAVEEALAVMGGRTIEVQPRGYAKAPGIPHNAGVSVHIAGTPVSFSNSMPNDSYGIAAVLLERETLDIKFAKYFGPDPSKLGDLTNWLVPLRKEVLAETAKLSDYLVVLAGYGPGVFQTNPGHGDSVFLSEMEGWGVSTYVANTWGDPVPASGGVAFGAHSGFAFQSSYVLIGGSSLGPGNGVEFFATGLIAESLKNQVSVKARLYPEPVKGGYRFTPRPA